MRDRPSSSPSRPITFAVQRQGQWFSLYHISHFQGYWFIRQKFRAISRPAGSDTIAPEPAGPTPATQHPGFEGPSNLFWCQERYLWKASAYPSQELSTSHPKAHIYVQKSRSQLDRICLTTWRTSESSWPEIHYLFCTIQVKRSERWWGRCQEPG